jgi:L,D-peptidoglycan transpeptidase YkuD (ErfK/YbiS/YcfS/YnhG family)
MNIELKNKFLYFQNYKLRCSIGKRGISIKKKKEIKKLQKVNLNLNTFFIVKIVYQILKQNLKKYIKKKMGWCDDPNSIYYNKIINYPFKYSSEKLWLKENITILL